MAVIKVLLLRTKQYSTFTVTYHPTEPAPQFETTMYTVPEDDPGSVPLCVDLGVEITEPLTYTITTAQKSPPEAEGMLLDKNTNTCHTYSSSYAFSHLYHFL